MAGFATEHFRDAHAAQPNDVVYSIPRTSAEPQELLRRMAGAPASSSLAGEGEDLGMELDVATDVEVNAAAHDSCSAERLYFEVVHCHPSGQKVITNKISNKNSKSKQWK